MPLLDQGRVHCGGSVAEIKMVINITTTVLLLLNIGLMEDGRSEELTGDDDDFVMFAEFATNGRSDIGNYFSNNNHDKNVVS